jgi:peptidoglycan/LPS O-acetylase OafA/YrhL
MISAFLFWGKVLQSDKPISALRLYRSRNRRLTPMYVFSVLLVLLIVAVRTDFTLQVGLGELTYQILSWFSYGFLSIPVMPDINGLKDTHTIESVYWTLMFEWEFYLLLPLFARLPARTLTMVGLMFITYFFGPPAIVAINFAFGAIAAHIMHHYDLKEYLRGRHYDVLMVVILVLVLALFPRGHGLPQYILGFLFFMLLVNRNDMFGLLTSPAAKFIGAISYSVYLLHNITLNQMFYSYDAYQPIETISSSTFWVLVGLSGVLTILFSALTFRFIEYRFYGKPRAVGAGWGAPVRTGPQATDAVTANGVSNAEKSSR